MSTIEIAPSSSPVGSRPVGLGATKRRPVSSLPKLETGAILTAVAGVIVASPLAQSPYFQVHDAFAHLFRLFVLDSAIRQGVLYPRWSPELVFGLGYPIFNFYNPLLSYLAEAFHLVGLGFTDSIRIVVAIAILFSGLGMYWFLRPHLGQAGGLLGAVAYLFVPYHLLVVYVRGAFAEELCYAIFPVALGLADRAFLDRARVSPGFCLGLAFGLAALILAHNPSALVFSGVVGLFVLWRAGPGSVVPLAGTYAVALGLTAFFWLPFLVELPDTWIATFPSGVEDFYRALTTIEHLVQSSPAYDYDAVWETTLKLGLVQAALAVTGIVALVRATPPSRPLGLFAAAIGVLLLFLMTRPSELLWRLVPLASLMSFPWRLLASIGVMTAIATAFVVPARGFLRWPVALAGCGVLIWSSLSQFSTTPLDLADSQVSRASATRLDVDGALTGTTSPAQFVPRWVAPPVQRLTDPALEANLASSALLNRIRVKSFSGWGYRFQATVDRAGTFLLRTFYFPGWKATIDGVPVPIRPEGNAGQIALDLPAGTHIVEITWGSTPIRLLAGISTIATLLTLAAWTFLTRTPTADSLRGTGLRENDIGPMADRPSPSQGRGLGEGYPSRKAQGEGRSEPVGTTLPLPRMGEGPHPGGTRRPGGGPWLRAVPTGVLVLAAVFLGIAFWLPPPNPAIAATEIPFGESLVLTGWRPDYADLDRRGVVRIDLLWYVRGSVRFDYREQMQLVDRAGRVRAEQMRRPTYGSSPTRQWSVGSLVPDSLDLALPADLEPGDYQLRLQLLADDVPSPATIVGTLTVPRRPTVPVPEPPARQRDAVLGDQVALRGYTLVGPSSAAPGGLLAGRTLSVFLTWELLRPMEIDYSTFVHLVDTTGAIVAQADSLPGFDLGLTSAWEVGRPVRVRFDLPIPADTPPGLAEIRVGLFRRPTGERLPVSPPGSGTTIVLESIVVEPTGRLSPGQPASVGWPGLARLTGYDLPGRGGSAARADCEEIVSDCQNVVTLYWEGVGLSPEPLVAFVHFLDQTGRPVAQHDSEPRLGRWPTTYWRSGDRIVDHHPIAGLDLLPPGQYRVAVGLYERASGQRVRIGDDDLAIVGTIDIGRR